MRILALDIGEKWIGVAMSDPLGMLASPLTRVRAEDAEAAIGAIARTIKENQVGLVVVGMPYSLSGVVGPQARRVQTFVDLLASRLDVEVVTWDERSSTIAADQLLAEAGIPLEKRREMIDAAAAAFILQSYLDSQPARGILEDEHEV